MWIHTPKGDAPWLGKEIRTDRVAADTIHSVSVKDSGGSEALSHEFVSKEHRLCPSALQDLFRGILSYLSSDVLTIMSAHRYLNAIRNYLDIKSNSTKKCIREMDNIENTLTRMMEGKSVNPAAIVMHREWLSHVLNYTDIGFENMYYNNFKKGA